MRAAEGPGSCRDFGCAGVRLEAAGFRIESPAGAVRTCATPASSGLTMGYGANAGGYGCGVDYIVHKLLDGAQHNI